MSADSGHSVAMTSTPEDLDQGFAAFLRMSKCTLLDSTADGTIRQTGGAYLEPLEPLEPVEPIPAPPTELLSISEPLIETFVVDHSGSCTATGTDEALIAHVLGPAIFLATRTLDAMAAADVELEPTGYLTASVTPSDQVMTTPHVDDDQYEPAAGVGLVATAANLGGSRIANEPIVHRPARPHLPLEFDQAVLEAFDRGMLSTHQAAEDRIVVFPQFGQLHAGPTVRSDLIQANPVRTLLVLRFGTVPRT